MMTLRDVSVNELGMLLYEQKIDIIIRRLRIKTIYDLIDAMDIYPDINWSKINQKIEKIKKNIDRYNETDKELTIYPTSSYQDKTLEYTDTLNRGNVLLLENPTLPRSVRYCDINTLSIDKIKSNLMLVRSDGKNCLQCSSRKVGQESINKIVEKLEIYNEQVIRQSKLTSFRDFNVFTYQRKEKFDVAYDNYKDIVNYLIDNVDDQVLWGNVSDKQKIMYLSSTENNRQMDRVIKDRVLNNIVNYTTLPELEQVARGNQEVLNRFIKK